LLKTIQIPKFEEIPLRLSESWARRLLHRLTEALKEPVRDLRKAIKKVIDTIQDQQ